MLLYPDQRVEQPDNETVCFGAPIDKCDWEYLNGRSKVLSSTGMAFVIIDCSDSTDVYFMRNDSEVNDRVCVVLRDKEDPDKCIESAAWIRIQENFPGMIFICRGTVDADKWQTYAAAIGASEECTCMVDLDMPRAE